MVQWKASNAETSRILVYVDANQKLRNNYNYHSQSQTRLLKRPIAVKCPLDVKPQLLRQPHRALPRLEMELSEKLVKSRDHQVTLANWKLIKDYVSDDECGDDYL